MEARDVLQSVRLCTPTRWAMRRSAASRSPRPTGRCSVRSTRSTSATDASAYPTRGTRCLTNASRRSAVWQPFCSGPRTSYSSRSEKRPKPCGAPAPPTRCRVRHFEGHTLTAASCIFSPKDGIAGAASPAPASPVLFPIAFMRGSNARTARRAP